MVFGFGLVEVPTTTTTEPSSTVDPDYFVSLVNYTVQTSNNVTKLQAEYQSMRRDMDGMFLLFCAIFTSFVQVGFACLEAGFVNSKNVTSIIFKNVLDTFICAIVYWLVGYSLAFTPGNAFIGYSHWAGMGIPDDEVIFWVFQFIFASTASTIVSGSVAERCSFISYLVYSSVISGLVYPVVSRWVWYNGGWLSTLHFLDVAGCAVVHVLGGTCALVAAIFLGPRMGRFKEGKVAQKPGHSMGLIGIGGLILISGFLGFNAGSVYHVSGHGPQMGRAVQNTLMGGAGAAAVVLVLCRAGVFGDRKWVFPITVNAIITGIVAVCGGLHLFSPGMALLSGGFGCSVYLLVRQVLLRLHIDDPVDSIGVHLGGGLTGVITGSLFNSNGIVFGITDASVEQVWVNLVGGLAIFTWAAVCSIVMFGCLWLTGLLRVSEEDEIHGLDMSELNEPAYPVQGWSTDYPVEIHKTNSVKEIFSDGSYTLNRSQNGHFIMVGPRIVKLTMEEHTV